jgi:2-oxo-3-hexenedioate decarboxylase
MANPAVAAGMKTMLARRSAELEGGAESVGWKIGINVGAVQEQLGVDAPVVGYLTSAGAVDDRGRVAIGGWTNPMLEPEVAIRIGPDGSSASLAPAIELVDLDIPLDDVERILARNVFQRGFLIGAERSGITLDRATCRVSRDGREIASVDEPFDGEAIAGHVREFLAAHGAELAAGEWIIAGSLTPPVALKPGEQLEVTIEDLGSVSVETVDRLGPNR